MAFFPNLWQDRSAGRTSSSPNWPTRECGPLRETAASAVSLILVGFFKKIVIADALAPYVTQTFQTAGHEGAVQLVLGTYAFALQIYGDFCGYTDIAASRACSA